jgi:antitoxin component of MazEF toxin-antitoxin module
MWKDKGQQANTTITVRPFNGGVIATIPRDILRHLGAEAGERLVFKLRSNKSVSIKVLKMKREKLLAFKPLARRKKFPALSNFLIQR